MEIRVPRPVTPAPAAAREGKVGRGEGGRDPPAPMRAEADVVGGAGAPLEAARPSAPRSFGKGGDDRAARHRNGGRPQASPPKRRLYPIPLRGEDAVLGRAHLGHGRAQRDPGLLLRRRPLPSSTRCAVHHGLALFEAGADIVDVGGESTRPGGAAAVDDDEEFRRVVPVIRAPARPRGGPALRRHHQGGGGARGPRRGRRPRQRRQRLPFDPGHGPPWWRERRRARRGHAPARATSRTCTRARATAT